MLDLVETVLTAGDRTRLADCGVDIELRHEVGRLKEVCLVLLGEALERVEQRVGRGLAQAAVDNGTHVRRDMTNQSEVVQAFKLPAS